MVELGYRKNPIPIITSANDILSEQDPAATFQAMVQSAENGTLFIDEAYHFNPAPRGSTANASNKVLDFLMKISETKRSTPTSTPLPNGGESRAFLQAYWRTRST